MATKTGLFAAVVLTWAASVLAAAPDTQYADQDAFIAGYASAVLEHDFHLEPTRLTVKDRVIQVETQNLGAAEKANIYKSLRSIAGVQDVEFVEEPVPAPAPHEANRPTPAPDGAGVQTSLSPHPWTFLAPTNTFDPLLADPRWPQFSAAYVRYTGRPQANGGGQTDRDAGNVSFGESLALLQWSPEPKATMEVGVQAALFADFDLDRSRVDLINADYFVGPDLEYRRGDFSALLRIYHQSSHLGDNYLYNNPGAKHFELTYEKPDLLVSYDLFHKTLRLYGGGGYLVDVEPKSLSDRPGVVEYGMEYYAPPFNLNATAVTPVAAIDIQNRQENNWSADFSVRAGLQFQDPSTFGRRLDLLLEYYNGHSPNGQFYLQNIQSLGVGLHFFL
jgi:hypothetical protein